MNTRSRLPRSGLALCVFLNGLAMAIAAPEAMADSAAHPAAGALKVPNARLETATPEMMQSARRMLASRSGVRAFKDPVTGQLRDQTPEEMVVAGSIVAPDSEATATLMMPGGGELALGDESLLSNAIVTREPTGKLRYQCLDSDSVALENILKGKTGKGHDHAR